MSYVSTDYGTANEFLNGKHNGWILMYSYLMRMAVWCFALVAAIGMLRKRNPWNYVVMLTLLGGMIFHVFWEANPKYSICFMGVMMFMMVTGIENLCEEEKKEQKQKISMGNVMLCLVGIGLIVCLQPMHNYLKQNPEALDQSYAASQFAQSQTLNLSLKKNEAIKQSFLTKIRFQNITFNLLNNENDFIVRLLDETGKVMESARQDQLSYAQNQYEWKLNKVKNSGTYAIEIVNQKKIKNTNFRYTGLEIMMHTQMDVCIGVTRRLGKQIWYFVYINKNLERKMQVYNLKYICIFIICYIVLLPIRSFYPIFIIIKIFIHSNRTTVKIVFKDQIMLLLSNIRREFCKTFWNSILCVEFFKVI